MQNHDEVFNVYQNSVRKSSAGKQLNTPPQRHHKMGDIVKRLLRSCADTICMLMGYRIWETVILSIIATSNRLYIRNKLYF